MLAIGYSNVICYECVCMYVQCAVKKCDRFLLQTVPLSLSVFMGQFELYCQMRPSMASIYIWNNYIIDDDEVLLQFFCFSQEISHKNGGKKRLATFF